MTDGKIKGEGNSRYLKTVSDALSRYPTHEALVEALVAGTFPIDLNGINAAGWEQIGTALNKNTLLADTTATALELTPDDPTANDAFMALKGQLDGKAREFIIYSPGLPTKGWARIASFDDYHITPFYLSIARGGSQRQALLCVVTPYSPQRIVVLSSSSTSAVSALRIVRSADDARLSVDIYNSVDQTVQLVASIFPTAHQATLIEPLYFTPVADEPDGETVLLVQEVQEIPSGNVATIEQVQGLTNWVKRKPVAIEAKFSLYTSFVIPLVKLQGTEQAAYFLGSIKAYRGNNVNGEAFVVNINAQQKHVSNQAIFSMSQQGGTGNSRPSPVRFLYNGVYYFGVYVSAAAPILSHAVLEGMATDWQIMDSIGIYDRANDTVLNEEIYNSLEYLTPNRENYLVGSPKIRKYATDGTFVDYNIASVAPYNVTVPTGWTTDSAGRYYKTVTVNGLLATDTPVADVVLGTDRAANRLYRQAWGNVTDIQTAANAITFYADDTAPTTAMTVQLQVVR